MLKTLNFLMHGFHLGLITFFLVGWIFPPLRTAHIIMTGVIFFSWFGIGLVIRQPGFCLATEIQYHIRKRLGLQMERDSYIVYLCEKLTGHRVSPWRAEVVTQAVFYVLGATGIALKCFA